MSANAEPDYSLGLCEMALAGARDGLLPNSDRARWLVQDLRCRGYDLGAEQRSVWLISRGPIDVESQALWREMRTEVHAVLVELQGGSFLAPHNHPALSSAGDLL